MAEQVNTAVYLSQTVQPVSDAQNILLTGDVTRWIYPIIGVLGMIFNLFVIIVIASSRQLKQQPRNWFIFHQSIADCLTAFFFIISTTKSATIILEEVHNELN